MDGTDDRIPVTLLTGHLGSGKTTLLNAWLRAPDTHEVAVVINEFGDVGLDHLLVRETTENLMLLENGCLCCMVRDDLIAMLRDLAVRRDGGTVPAFQRVVIETTGLADPAPVIHSLMNDLGLVLRFRLDRVLTTVAAVPGRSTLETFAEARKQVAFADALAVTKTDLADPASLLALETALRRINPRAEFLHIVGGKADRSLFEGGGFDPGTRGEEVERWLGIEATAAARHHHHHHHHHHHQEHDTDEPCPDCAAEVSRHGADIGSFCLIRDAPLAWGAAQRWLDRLAAEHGPDLLRVKGLLNVVEWPNGAVIVHGVQHLFHPPEMREGWPTADHSSRIVFITRGIPARVIEDALASAEREAAMAPP